MPWGGLMPHYTTNAITYLNVSLKFLVLPSSSSKNVSSGIFQLTYLPAVTGIFFSFFCSCGGWFSILCVTIAPPPLYPGIVTNVGISGVADALGMRGVFRTPPPLGSGVG